ncbi:MAG TPA: cyclic nucleotide-binding domain-containing protein [Terriglobales bacterium]
MPLKYLTENDVALLRSIASRRTFKPREIIIAVNSQPNALYILTAGSASVELVRGKSIAKLSPGDICGEMAFLENKIASATVVAETDAEVEVLELPDVDRIFALYPHLQARFYKSLALLLSQRLRATSSRLAKMAQS